MVISDTGIILRTRLLTETSLIVLWLTREHGRLSTVAKGARRPKSPFLGKLDVFYSADLSYLPSRRSDLHTLRELRLVETRPFLRLSLGSLQQAAYGAALIEQTTESDTPLPEMFRLFEGFLQALAAPPLQTQTVLAFELKLLHLLGLAAEPEETRLPAAAQTLLRRFLGEDWPQLAPAAESAPLRALEQYLHGFLIYQFGRLARGRQSALHPV